MTRTYNGIVAALFIALLASPAAGANGNELYQWLQAGKKLLSSTLSYDGWEKDLERSALAEGYIKGIVDSSSGRLFCLPDGVTYKQLGDITLQSLENEPENRHHTASLIIIRAFGQKFPCAKK